MATKLLSTRAGRPSGLAVLATLAVGLVVFYYFTGADATLPVRLVPHLQEIPLTLEYVNAGAVRLPVQASGFITTFTHDVAGPFTAPGAAIVLVGLLAVVLAGWTAVVSTLSRTAFVVGMVPVIFFLLSLNTESLGVFGTGERYFLYLMLGLIGSAAFGLHAFAESLSLARRGAIMALVVAGLGGLLFAQSPLSATETALQLAAYATLGGAVLFALLVLWVGVENIRALLWFNAQAEQPGSRFGLGPFLGASLLYLGVLFLYVWNGSVLPLFPGVNLDPLVLLLPAVLAGGLGLRLRAPSYGEWVPHAQGMAQLYPLVVMGAAGALAYAFATDNTPLLVAAHEFTGLSLLLVGGGFFIYVLMNFMPLIQRRLRVYRVVFEPRRLPFYTVYILALGGIAMVQTRQNLTLPDQVQAGQYNNLGDLTRQQSEGQPDELSLALLAERYYAESGDVLYRGNLHAQMGRAALYRFRQQRQNEINALNRALQRAPSAKVSLWLAALHGDPSDLFEGLDILRRGLRAAPNNAALTGDLAQFFTQTALTDSVAFYLDRAEQLAPGSYASQTNQLGFLLSQDLLNEARKLREKNEAQVDEPALASNYMLLQLLGPIGKAEVAPPVPAEGIAALDDASFAQLYHLVLLNATKCKDRLTNPLLVRLSRLANEPANENYYEQLLFLQAVARHARGEEQTARQLLLPLASGTTASAAYYQQLLGMWQLQQGQYATAADQLEFAATHGATQAREARVYALALSGRPDSARAAASRLAASPDSVQRRWGQQAQRQLATAGTLVSKTASRIGSDWLAQAQRAEQQGNPAGAAKSYQRIVREAPFNEAAVVAAGRFYTRQRNSTAAYEALRAGLAENPESVGLLRAYALAAADAGLTEYAVGALAQLRQRLPAPAYATLAAEYATRQATRAAQADSFSVAPATPPLQ